MQIRPADTVVTFSLWVLPFPIGSGRAGEALTSTSRCSYLLNLCSLHKAATPGPSFRGTSWLILTLNQELVQKCTQRVLTQRGEAQVEPRTAGVKPSRQRLRGLGPGAWRCLQQSQDGEVRTACSSAWPVYLGCGKPRLNETTCPCLRISASAQCHSGQSAEMCQACHPVGSALLRPCGQIGLGSTGTSPDWTGFHGHRCSFPERAACLPAHPSARLATSRGPHRDLTGGPSPDPGRCSAKIKGQASLSPSSV